MKCLLNVLTETTDKTWLDFIFDNANVVFYILGGIGAILAMIIGVILIRRRKKVKVVEVKEKVKKSKKD